MRNLPGRHRPVTLYLSLACLISWVLWAPLWLPAFGVDGLPALRFQHALGALGPFSAAFLTSYITSGRVGIIRLLRSMLVDWRSLPWAVLALVGPLFLLLGAMAAISLLGAGSFDLSRIGQSAEFPGMTALGYFLYNLFTFGYGEETGWRGFALPRLQRRYRALPATVLLSAGWAWWHLPLFWYRPGYSEMGVAGAAGWLFSLVTGSILLTWLFNSSRGSVLVVAVFHAAMDVAFVSESVTPLVMNVTGALVTVCGLMVLVLAGPAELSSRGSRIRWGNTADDEVRPAG